MAGRASLFGMMEDVAQLAGMANDALTDADIKKNSLAFSESLDRKLMDFQNRNDYGNFQGEIEEFFEEQREAMNSGARTPRAARYLNDMLDKAHSQSRINVEDAVTKAKRRTALLDYADANARILGSNVSAGEKIAGGVANIDAEYMSGLITEDEYRKQVTAYSEKAIYDTALKNGLGVLKRGGTLDEALAASREVTGGEYDISTLVAGTMDRREDKGALVDRKAMQDTVAKALNAEWNTTIKRRQEDNASKLSEMTSAIILNDNESKLPGMIAEAKKALLGMTGNQLSDGDRDKYAKLIKSLENTMSSVSQTTKSGNSAVKVEAFKWLSENKGQFVKAACDGTFENLNAAKEAWVTEGLERYNETAATPKELNEFMWDNAKEIDSFLTEAEKSGYLPAEASALASEFKNISKSYVKNESGKGAEDFFAEKGMFYAEEMEKMRILALDMVSQCNLADEKELSVLVSRFTNQLGALYLDKLDFELKHKLLDGKSDEPAISRLAYNLGKDESAYTTGDGIGENLREHFAPGAKEGAEQLAKETMQHVEDVEGIDRGALTWTNERTKNDINAQPIIMNTKNGDQYKIVSGDGKTYRFLKSTDGGKSWTELKKPKDAAKEKQGAAHDETKRLQAEAAREKTEDFFNDAAETTNQAEKAKEVAADQAMREAEEHNELEKEIGAVIENNLIPPGYTREKWLGLSDKKKRDALRKLRKEKPEEYKRLVSGSKSTALKIPDYALQQLTTSNPDLARELMEKQKR